MTKKIPSKYQKNIYSFVQTDTKSAIINASAGSGKTFTIVESTKLLKKSDVLLLAFNRSIAQELQKKIPPFAKALTLNSVGHRTWMSYLGSSVEVKQDKSREILRENINVKKDGHLEPAVVRLVSLAKSHGYIPNGMRLKGTPVTFEIWKQLIDNFDIDINPLEAKKVSELAEMVLKLGISQKRVIDFDDQMYLPVCYNARFRQYDVVFIDEAQDVSHIQRHMLKKIVKPRKGRLLAFGDRSQSVYGFRGAAHDAIDRIKEDFNCQELPLSISYRCPKSVVKLAQTIVPEIEYHEDAIDGEIKEPEDFDLMELQPKDYIICRYNSPIIKTAYCLLRRRVPVNVLGKDIGQGMITLIKRSKKHKIDQMVAWVMNWADKEVQRALKKGNEDKIDTIKDKEQSICVMAEMTEAESCKELIQEISTMFESGKGVTLSTVHKAKGLEADRIYILDGHLMPSKRVKKDWQRQQERNIQYVAYTRAKKELIFINSKQIN